MRHESVRLFVERAEAVAPGFRLNEQNAPAVARICQRLDGIPLAIELAAVRVRVLSATQIAARLDDRFLLLTGGSRVALPRQRTLLATMDWSHELLSEQREALFRRISAFANGFTLEAAEDGLLRRRRRARGDPRPPLQAGGQVAGARGTARRRCALPDARDGRRSTPRGSSRGREKKSPSGAGTRTSSCGWRRRPNPRSRVRIRESGWTGSTRRWATCGRRWRGCSKADETEARPAAGERVVGVLPRARPLREGRAWLEDALSKGGDPTPLRARALTGAGVLAFLQCDYGGPRNFWSRACRCTRSWTTGAGWRR